MPATLCAYEGPKVEELPTEIADVVNSALKQLPESAKLILKEIPFDPKAPATDEMHLVNYEDFSVIYIGNKEDTDIELALLMVPPKKYSETVFLNQPKYHLRIEGKLPPGTRRQALGYDASKLWTVARPGDKHEKYATLTTVEQWIEAVPKEQGYGSIGKRREKPAML